MSRDRYFEGKQGRRIRPVQIVEDDEDGRAQATLCLEPRLNPLKRTKGVDLGLAVGQKHGLAFACGHVVPERQRLAPTILEATCAADGDSSALRDPGQLADRACLADAGRSCDELDAAASGARLLQAAE